MVAIKKFNMDKVKDEVNLIQHETILMKQLQHPNILKNLVSYVDDFEVCIVSPLMGFSSCRNLLNTHFSEGLPENAICLILKDVLQALEYIHRRGIIHRSIRANHVLLSENGHAYLTGFRYSCPIIENGKWQKHIHSFPNNIVRPNLNWLSPEVLAQNLRGYNEKSDIYSVGIVICELANGSEPYSEMPTTLMLTEKMKGTTPHLLDCTTVLVDDHDNHGDSVLKSLLQNQAQRRFSESLHEIAALCLQQEPSERPTAAQLLTHPYFKFNRKHMHLSEYLLPALPLSDKVAYNKEELESLENIRRMSDIELNNYEWDF
ncbi:hypothetical protein Trydic_g4396 [Trypoxylus dichotomus]